MSYENYDVVTKPEHYQGKNGLQVWDVVKAFIGGLNDLKAIHWYNALKYLLRFEKKNGVEDLKKAQENIFLLINEVEEVEIPEFVQKSVSINKDKKLLNYIYDLNSQEQYIKVDKQTYEWLTERKDNIIQLIHYFNHR